MANSKNIPAANNKISDKLEKDYEAMCLRVEKYLNTQDQYFNYALKYWFDEFPLRYYITKRTATDFDIFAKVFHDVYFFISDNQNLPFSCINKIKQVFIEDNLNEEDQIIILDRLIGVLKFKEGAEDKLNSINTILAELCNQRNYIRPYLTDAEYQQRGRVWLERVGKYTTENVLSMVSQIERSEDKIFYIRGVLVDLLADSQNGTLWPTDIAFINEVNFVGLCDAEIKKIQHSMSKDQSAKTYGNHIRESHDESDLSILKDIFITDYEDCISALERVSPPITKKNVYLLGERDRGCISAWINALKIKGKIKEPNKKFLVKLLNTQFSGLNLGTHGRSLSDVSTTAYKKYFKQFLGLIN